MDARQTAELIKNLLYSDSHVVLTSTQVERLANILEREQTVPSAEECEELVMGDDEGDTTAVSRRFPKTAAYIETFF